MDAVGGFDAINLLVYNRLLALAESCYHRIMVASARAISRRRFVFAGMAAGQLLAGEQKGAPLPSDVQRYPDPTTELEVYRLTSPDYTSTMTAYYNRGISRNSAWMLFCCDRNGTPQGFRMDLKTGEAKQLTEAKDLDAASL